MKELLGIGSGLIILLMATALFASFLVDPVLILGLAIILAAPIYFNAVFPYLSMQVPPGKAWTVSDRYTTESSERQETFSGYRTILGQRECQAGFHWRLPWEEPNKQIDMERQIVVENEAGVFYTMADGKTIRLRWRLFITPLPGNIVNFTRTREDDIRRRVHDRAHKFLQGKVGNMTSIGFGEAQQLELKTEFEKVFGGPLVIDEEERAMGIWTGTPEIIGIDQPESVQQAMNYKQEMLAVIQTANDMTVSSNGRLSYEGALKMALLGKGVKIDFVEIAAGLFPTGGRGGRRGGNQNTQP